LKIVFQNTFEKSTVQHVVLLQQQVSVSVYSYILHRHLTVIQAIMTCLNQETSQDFLNYLKAMENKSIFHKKDVTLNPRHDSKQDRLDRQISTALISFNSFFKLEHDPMLQTCRSSLGLVINQVYNRFKHLTESTFFIIL